MNTFVSAGSDGVMSFWDKEARHRLANMGEYMCMCVCVCLCVPPVPAPIPALDPIPVSLPVPLTTPPRPLVFLSLTPPSELLKKQTPIVDVKFSPMGMYVYVFAYVYAYAYPVCV
jgi:hypothetical protein